MNIYRIGYGTHLEKALPFLPADVKESRSLHILYIHLFRRDKRSHRRIHRIALSERQRQVIGKIRAFDKPMHIEIHIPMHIGNMPEPLRLEKTENCLSLRRNKHRIAYL